MRFDPFQSGECRKTRNTLSESLMEAIQDRDMTPPKKAARRLESAHKYENIREYINNRLERYGEVIKCLQAENISPDETYKVVLLLWNNRLFFEVHEWLEPKWLKADGAEKEILQALIRAAGTYILLEYSRYKGAKKMAAKAVVILRRHRELLPDYLNCELLTAKLEAIDPVPPVLGSQNKPV